LSSDILQTHAQVLAAELQEVRAELSDCEAAVTVWRRRAEEADQKLLKLARLLYRRYPDGRTHHESMSGGCDAYQSLYPYEDQEPPGLCNCGANATNVLVDEILGPLKKELE
jgi:hypothetical protein